MTDKAKRVCFTDLERRAICQLDQQNPKWTQQELTEQAAKQLNKSLKRSTITGILKEKTKWLKVEDSSGSRKHHKEAKWKDLETALFEWFGQVIAASAPTEILQVEQVMTDEELVAFVTGGSQTAADSQMEDADEIEVEAEVQINIPSLSDAQDQLRGLAMFVGEEPRPRLNGWNSVWCVCMPSA